MRLLKIGRDASNDIVLHSDKVSTLHAEITLLDSGDIQLEDKNSRNGTYIMNQRIQPGKPVNVRRGDAIRFADVELQWSQVPMPEDNSAYKAIFGIGSNFNNDLQIAGATVSRYHATIKLGRDNKMYIVDHSKNGTTVNGVKITSHQPYRIKKSSAVVCGGVPVDTSRLPWPSELWKAVLGVAAALLVVAGVGLGVWKWIGSAGNPSIQALQRATACVVEQYYVEVTFKDDPFIGKIKGWPEKWTFGLDNDGKLTLGSLTQKVIRPLGGRGTAFFISKDGELGTNRHIACPWAYLTNDQKDDVRQQIVLTIKEVTKSLQSEVDFGNALLSAFEDQLSYEQQQNIKNEINNIDAYLTRILRSDYEISGSFEYIGIALTGSHISTIADMLACQVIAESGDEQKDCALLRLNSKHTPDDIIKSGYFDIEKARVDEMSLKPQEEELTTIGYPAQFGIDEDLVGKGKEFLPTIHRTYISKTPDDDMFQLQSNVVGGQSGSPVIDKERQLVGIVWGSHRGTEVAYACNVKHLKELYDKNKARNQ